MLAEKFFVVTATEFSKNLFTPSFGNTLLSAVFFMRLVPKIIHGKICLCLNLQ